MNRCLFCQEVYLPSWELGNLWTRQVTCSTCKIKFVKRGECVDCGKPGSTCCSDCTAWQEQGLTVQTTPLYLYIDAAKTFMHRFKFLGDTALLEMFTDDLKKVKIKQAVLVPIPLSIERLADRHFNQAEAIARQMRGKIVPYLSRVDGPAQSKVGRKARLARSNPFCVSGDVKGKNIVLIDDVYTTGVTLRQAMIRLKEAGAKEISAVTLFRSV